MLAIQVTLPVKRKLWYITQCQEGNFAVRLSRAGLCSLGGLYRGFR